MTDRARRELAQLHHLAEEGYLPSDEVDRKAERMLDSGDLTPGEYQTVMGEKP